MLAFQRLEIPEVQLITPAVFSDERGYFKETYKKSEFIKNGIIEDFVQRNVSVSNKNVLRGLHFQTGDAAQGKLVNCFFGEILDVAVDIRAGSKSFGRYVSATLSESNHQLLYIPAGFAHGFLVLSPFATVEYLTTSEYKQSAEGGIVWNDATINIRWSADTPLISSKDASYPTLLESDVYKQHLEFLGKGSI